MFMLQGEILVAIESGDPEIMLAAKNEIERVVKVRDNFESKRYTEMFPLEKLQYALNQYFVTLLDGKESTEWNGYNLSLKPTNKFIFDIDKLKSFLNENKVKLSDAEFKNQFYSHKIYPGKTPKLGNLK